jgi:hypothetical protein
MKHIFDKLIKILEDIIGDLIGWAKKLIADIFKSPPKAKPSCVPAPYDNTLWRPPAGKDKPRTLILSENPKKRYNCSEYTYCKLSDDKNRWPKAGANIQVTTKNIIAKLEAMGFVKTDKSKCGCEKGEQNQCAVLYIHTDYIVDGKATDVAHAVAYDWKHCDWGGKISSTGTIKRWKKADDWVPATETNKYEQWYYCKTKRKKNKDFYKSDYELHLKGEKD